MTGNHYLEHMEKTIGRLDAEAPEVTLSHDAAVRTRFAGVGAQGLVDFEVLPNVMKRKPRGDIASKSRIARPFDQAAKLNDSFPSSAACAMHTAYTPPP